MLPPAHSVNPRAALLNTLIYFQFKPEGRTFAHFALYSVACIVQFQNIFYNRKSESGSHDRPLVCLVHFIVAVPHIRKRLRSDSLAAVRHFDPHISVLPHNLTHPDLFVIPGVIDCVIDQIVDDLEDFVLVRLHHDHLVVGEINLITILLF